MTISTAADFEIKFAYIRTDENGFKSSIPWKLCVEAARAAAVENEHESPWETGACDATETLTFADGSQLMIANPRQAAFGGFVRTLK